VKAAIVLADADGLEAVSLRNVAARLGAGPMRLYAYTSTKEGLLDLMIDAVYLEMGRDAALRGEWRAVLRDLAVRLRSASMRHPWFIGLLGGRPHLGPNALAFQERVLAAVQRTIPHIDEVLDAVRTMTAWAVGAVHMEANDLAAERRSGLDERAWQESIWPWLREQLDTGAYPTMSQVALEAKHATSDVTFERGIECVLGGIAARRPPRKRR
jgi:AcrR family transcriptional regulator